MIDVHTWKTPNGRKIAIMLEEARLDYQVKLVDITRNEQFGPAFLKISPNNKIPAIVDHDAPGGPLTICESGAILLHLAERAGMFLSSDARVRASELQWLFWQVGGFGPMLGQFSHFAGRKDAVDPYPLKRFTDEAARLFGVLDRRLGETEHVGGPAYSVADMAIYPWSVYARARLETAASTGFSNVARWEAQLAQRPALGRGMASLST
jgi:GSH-dependent disulfide-bond oxidoreductase